MKRPNFFIVGAPKCGTTALYQYLNEHPQIYMSPVKEPRYFGMKSSFRNEAEYLALYDGAKEEIRLGEASPNYLRTPEACEAIYQFDPNAKIIIMLRDPVGMMMSAYSHLHMVGFDQSPTFAEALAKQVGKPVAGPGEPMIYRHMPLFTDHVQRYFERFGRANVHIIIYDDLRRDPAEVYRQTLEFLGVDPDFQPEFTVVNARKQVRSQALQKLVLALGIDMFHWKQTRLARRLRRIAPAAVLALPLKVLRRIYLREQPAPPVDPELRRQLQAEFAPEIERLSRLLGRDLTHWCQP